MLFAIIIAIAAVVIIGTSAFVLLRDRNEGLVIDDPSPTTVLEEPPLVDATELVESTPEPVVEDAPRPSFRERLTTARSAFGGYLGSIFTSGGCCVAAHYSFPRW